MAALANAARRGLLARRLQPQGTGAELRRPPGHVRRLQREPLEARVRPPHVDGHPAWPSTEWQLYTSTTTPTRPTTGRRRPASPSTSSSTSTTGRSSSRTPRWRPSKGRRVSAELYDASGGRLARQSGVLGAAANATTQAFTLDEAPAAGRPLYFVSLRLASREGRALSDNFYWQAGREEDHRALNDLPRSRSRARPGSPGSPGVSRVEVELRNPSKSVVLMVKPTLRARRRRSGSCRPSRRTATSRPFPEESAGFRSKRRPPPALSR